MKAVKKVEQTTNDIMIDRLHGLQVMEPRDMRFQANEEIYLALEDFLQNGDDLFAKYGNTIYDTQGLRAIQISSDILSEDLEIDEKNIFDCILTIAFEEVETVTFDIAFLPESLKKSITYSVQTYMSDYANVPNKVYDLNPDEEA